MAHWPVESEPVLRPRGTGYGEDDEGSDGSDGRASPPLESTSAPPPLFVTRSLPSHGGYETEYGGEEEEEEEYEGETAMGEYGEKIEFCAPVSYARACGGGQEAWLVLIQDWEQHYIVVPEDSPAADFLVRYSLLHTTPPYAAPKAVDPESWRQFASARQSDPGSARVPPSDQEREREWEAARRRHNGVYMHLDTAGECGEEGGGGGPSGPPPAAVHLPSSDDLDRIRREVLEPRRIRFMLAPTYGYEGAGEDGSWNHCQESEGGDEGGYDADSERALHSMLLHRELVNEWGSLQRVASDPKAEEILPILETDVLEAYETEDGDMVYSEYGSESDQRGDEGEYDDDLGEFVYKPRWEIGLAVRNPYVRYVTKPLQRASEAVLHSAQQLGHNAATQLRRFTEEEIEGMGAYDHAPRGGDGYLEGGGGQFDVEGTWSGHRSAAPHREDTRDRAREAQRAIKAGVQSLFSTLGWGAPPADTSRSASWVPTAGESVDAEYRLGVGEDPYLVVVETRPEEPNERGGEESGETPAAVAPRGKGREGGGNEEGGEEDEEGVPTLFPITDRTASAEELAITEGAWCRMTVHEFTCWRNEAQAPLSESLVLQSLASAAAPPLGGVRWIHDALGNDEARIDALRRAVRTNIPATVALGDSMERLLSICAVLVDKSPEQIAENRQLWEVFQNAAAAARDSHYRCMARGEAGAPSDTRPPTPPRNGEGAPSL